MCLVPGTERCGIDLDDGGAGEGVCADEFVVGRVEGDDNDTDLAGNALGSPGEVAALDSQGSVFGVSTSGAYKMDSLVTNTGVGWLTSLLEGSVDGFMSKFWFSCSGSDGFILQMCIYLFFR